MKAQMKKINNEWTVDAMKLAKVMSVVGRCKRDLSGSQLIPKRPQKNKPPRRNAMANLKVIQAPTNPLTGNYLTSLSNPSLCQSVCGEC